MLKANIQKSKSLKTKEHHRKQSKAIWFISIYFVPIGSYPCWPSIMWPILTGCKLPRIGRWQRSSCDDRGACGRTMFCSSGCSMLQWISIKWPPWLVGFGVQSKQAPIPFFWPWCRQQEPADLLLWDVAMEMWHRPWINALLNFDIFWLSNHFKIISNPFKSIFKSIKNPRVPYAHYQVLFLLVPTHANPPSCGQSWQVASLEGLEGGSAAPGTTEELVVGQCFVPVVAACYSGSQ